MDLLARIDAVVDSAIASEKIVGSVTLVSVDGELAYARAAGWFDREAGIPMRRDAIFRLASVTKPMVAATALAMIERDLLALDAAVIDYLPYFTPKSPDGSPADIRIRHLLTHTSGLSFAFKNPAIGSGLFQTDNDHETNLRLIAAEPLLFAPGAGWEYGVSLDVLGAIIAKLHGGTLEDAVTHYVTGPLAMPDTRFHVTDSARLAIPYADGAPGLRRMADPDTVIRPDGSKLNFAPSRVFNPRAFQSGGSGMLGTADDLLKFFEAIRSGGGPILKPETVAAASINQIGDLPRRAQDAGQRFGYLSAIVADPAAANSPVAPGTLRWGGVYGHEWMVDPASGITIVSFTNTPYEGCNGQFPKSIRDAVYAG
jgi:CubicO group peptidase (beta-lactamase class C family)